jgi:hypothetical protein
LAILYDLTAQDGSRPLAKQMSLGTDGNVIQAMLNGRTLITVERTQITTVECSCKSLLAFVVAV